MTKRKGIWLWNIFFVCGAILVFFVSAVSVIKLSNSGKWIYSLVCAVFCFLGALLSSRVLEDQKVGKDQARRFIVTGSAAFLLAIGFKGIDIRNSPIPQWMNYSLYFSIPIYYAVYHVVFTAVFPKAQKAIRSSLAGPLSDGSHNDTNHLD